MKRWRARGPAPPCRKPSNQSPPRGTSPQSPAAGPAPPQGLQSEPSTRRGCWELVAPQWRRRAVLGLLGMLLFCPHRGRVTRGSALHYQNWGNEAFRVVRPCGGGPSVRGPWMCKTRTPSVSPASPSGLLRLMPGDLGLEGTDVYCVSPERLAQGRVMVIDLRVRKMKGKPEPTNLGQLAPNLRKGARKLGKADWRK